MDIQNAINKTVDNSGNFVLFFTVDAPKGFKAGIMTVELFTKDGKKLGEHRRKVPTVNEAYNGHFDFVVKPEQFEAFDSFKWNLTSYALKRTSGSGLKSPRYEDITDAAYLERNKRKLENMLVD
jgi:hypothetical protein